MLDETRIDEIVEGSKASIGKQELKVLLTTLADRDIKRVVEIGVHKGHSLNVWRKAFDPELLLGIENNRAELEIALIRKADATVIPLKSNDQLSYWGVYRHLKQLDPEDPFIDMLFIDGDHRKEAVEFDYTAYSPFVRPGGVIVFHDISIDEPQYEGLVEVRKAWDFIKIPHHFQEIEFEGETGIGVLFKEE